jgi:hypothetical protein
MRREVIATIALAIGLVGLTLDGFLITNGFLQIGIAFGTVVIVIVLAMLAYGSLMMHH